jgi:hypothetical protein
MAASSMLGLRGPSTAAISRSMSVFEFNEAGQIRHLDVYLQG